MLNHISIMGRLTRDPELRRTGSGIAVASFTLAVEDDYKGQDGNRKTIFVDCVAWRGLAETVEKYFSKGRVAIVAGKLDIRDWTDKDGNKRKNAEIIAENVYFGDSKKDGASGGNTNNPYSGYTIPDIPGGNDFALIDGDDDGQLPF